MAMNLAAVASIALLLTPAFAREVTSHPVGSVIKLLQELEGKVEKEGKAEEVTYMKFKKWCDNSQTTLAKAVKESSEAIDTLTDTVASKTKEETEVKENIKFLEDEIAKYEAEAAAAKKDRDDANKVYKAADKDFDTTIKAVDEGMKALKDSNKAALLQFTTPSTPREESALRQLIQQPLVLEQLSDSQREALSIAVFGGADKPVTEADILAKEKYAKTGQTYTFKSGNVIELLTSLKTHFEDSKRDATKAETAAANDFEMTSEARKAAIEAAKTAKDGKTKLLGEVQEDLNKAKSSLKDEKDELEADSKTLDDTTRNCNLKASQWQERSTLRNHEVKAMKAAVKILAEVSGVRTEKPDTKALPTSPKLLFLQVVDPKTKAVNLIKQEAHLRHSKQLAHFADEMASKLDGPFDVVNGMVQQMIFRLMAEQKDEDEHKRWCDLELETSENSKKSKSDKSKTLAAKIKDAKAASDELVLKIQALDKKVTKLTDFMTEATEVRKEGKKENALAIKDAEAAQAAIAKAEAVLTTYYKESGMISKEPWEFLQVDAPEPVKLPKNPETWGSSYTGVTDPTKADTGVIAVLKATAADFSKMEGETRAQEISDQQQFDKDMKDSAIDKARNSKESEMKSDENKRTLDKISSLEKQKKHVDSELGAVKQYLEDLKPACVNGDSTYEERKKARTSEIDALQKAQIILKDAFEEKPATKFLQTIRKHA